MNVLGRKASMFIIWYFLSDQIQKMFQKADKDGDGEGKYFCKYLQFCFQTTGVILKLGCTDYNWYERDLTQILLAKMYVLFVILIEKFKCKRCCHHQDCLISISLGILNMNIYNINISRKSQHEYLECQYGRSIWISGGNIDETITRQTDPWGVAQSSQLIRMPNFNVSAGLVDCPSQLTLLFVFCIY